MLRALIAACILLFAATAVAREVTGAGDPEAIADLRIAKGNRDIAEAWLIAPTTRYRHFVIGSRYEAGGLRLRMTDGTVLTLMLDNSHVFEDRQPRLADLDGDGRDEIVLVLTSVREGASLAVYGVTDNAIRLKAKTPFIGRPNRWLNPAGIADFDGDGRLDVALVAMPHLVKRLEIWTLQEGSLRQIATTDDVSNHRLGSRNTGMSAVADFDGDGIADLAVPDAARQNLRLIGFPGGRPRNIDRLFLSGGADGAISAERTATGWQFAVPLEGGGTDRLAWRTP